MSGLIAEMVKTFGKNQKVGGLESRSGQDIFCLKNVDTFTRTSVCELKMNTVAQAQLTVQTNILKHKNFIRNYWNFEKFESITKIASPLYNTAWLLPKFFLIEYRVLYSIEIPAMDQRKDHFPRILSKNFANLHWIIKLGF